MADSGLAISGTLAQLKHYKASVLSHPCSERSSSSYFLRRQRSIPRDGPRACSRLSAVPQFVIPHSFPGPQAVRSAQLVPCLRHYAGSPRWSCGAQGGMGTTCSTFCVFASLSPSRWIAYHIGDIGELSFDGRSSVRRALIHGRSPVVQASANSRSPVVQASASLLSVRTLFPCFSFVRQFRVSGFPKTPTSIWRNEPEARTG